MLREAWLHDRLDTCLFFFMEYNYPIRSRHHVRWHREADLLGCFRTDNQLELGWLLYRQITGVRALEILST